MNGEAPLLQGRDWGVCFVPTIVLRRENGGVAATNFAPGSHTMMRGDHPEKCHGEGSLWRRRSSC